MNPVRRYASVWLTAGLIVWIENLVTIEWSYPYCLSREDGPAYAAYGMPLPYWMWNGVASLEHNFVPHVYILNLVVLGLILFLAIRWILDRAVSRNSKMMRSGIGAVGCLLLLTHVALAVFLVSAGYFRPTISLSLDGYYRYSEFRPVRIGLYGSSATDCMPSPFWFPDGWHHN